MLTTTAGKISMAVLAALAAALAWLMWVDHCERKAAAPPLQGVGDLSNMIDPIGGDPSNIIEFSERSELVGVNEDGATRYRIAAETIEPLEDGRFKLTKLDAWLHLTDGRIRLRADRADLDIPSSEEGPQAGLVEGDVIVELLRERRAGAPSGTPGLEAVLTGRTDRLRFDAALGQLETASAVRVEGEGATLEMDGLLLQVADTGPRARLLYAKAGPGSFGYSPQEARASRKARGVAGARAGRSGRAGEPDPEPEVLIARSTDGVRLDYRGASIEAPALDLALALVEGRLPPDAIAEFRSDHRPAPRRGPGSADAGAAEAEPEATDALRFEWRSELVVQAVDDPEAARLGAQSVMARFSSADRAPVRLAHADSGAAATAGSVEYGATTRSLRLDPAGPHGIEADLPGVGAATLASAVFDLTNGVGVIDGAGRVADAGDAGEPARAAEWSGGANLAFDTSRGPVGAGGLILPTSIQLTDGVVLEDAGQRVAGGYVDARFSVAVGPDGPASRLTRVNVVDDVEAAGADGAALSAEAVEVVFDATAARLRPVNAIAKGGVRGVLDGESLEADAVDAEFVASNDAPGGPASVGPFHAEGSVVLASADGWSVVGDVLEGDALAGWAVVTGAPAELSLRDAGERGTITAERIDVFEAERRMAVDGPGAADWTLPGADGGEDERLLIEWTGGMDYRDAAGVAVCEGGVVADGRFGVERYGAEGDRLTVRLERETGAGAEADAQRRLASVVLDGGADAPADVEWSRLAPGGPDAPLQVEALGQLRGPRIAADLLARTIDAPGPGRLVVDDRRDAGGGAVGVPAVGVRGGSVFEWSDALSVRRDEGVARMTGRTRLLHRHARTGALTTLESQELTGRFSVVEPEDRVVLEGFTAAGAVLVSHDGIQIVCDRLNSTGGDRAEAEANPGNLVTVVDRTGRHFTAEGVELNLATGEWVRRGGGVITTPR